MKIKKALLVALCVIFATVGFTACGNSESTDSSSDTDSSKVVTVRIASDETKDTPCSKATEIFKSEVEKASNGTMKVEYYCNSAMGDEREIAESVNGGNLEMGIIAGAYMSTYDSNWYAVDMPYVFKDRDSMYKLLDGNLGDLLKKSLSKNSKIKCLDFADGSFRILLNTKKEVKNVSDIANLKFRSQDSQMNTTIYKAWGSTAVPMGFSEVYTALEQGTIDGVDTSPLYQVSGKFEEVGKYYTMTNHVALLMVSVINSDFYNSLTKDQKKIILDASKKAYSEQERSIVVKDENTCLDKMDKAGLKRTDLTKEGLNSFKSKSKKVYNAYKNKVDPKVYELLGIE